MDAQSPSTGVTAVYRIQLRCAARSSARPTPPRGSFRKGRRWTAAPAPRFLGTPGQIQGPPPKIGATPAALLSGASDIGKAFELVETGTRDGLEWIEAKPREREAGFERIRMGFGRDGLQAMELTDNFGQITILRFTALEPNAKVETKDFRFEPPKGVDVLGER